MPSEIAHRQDVRRGSKGFFADSEKMRDLERLREAVEDYEETPTCPCCREVMRLIKMRCIQAQYPIEEVRKAIAEATSKASGKKLWLYKRFEDAI